MNCRAVNAYENSICYTSPRRIPASTIEASLKVDEVSMWCIHTPLIKRDVGNVTILTLFGSRVLSLFRIFAVSSLVSSGTLAMIANAE